VHPKISADIASVVSCTISVGVPTDVTLTCLVTNRYLGLDVINVVLIVNIICGLLNVCAT
jgi:hypothetical protein